MKYILASASPRRKELLAQIGISFDVKVSSADEKTGTENLSGEEMVELLSYRKSVAVYEELLHKKELPCEPFVIIGSDTVVATKEAILGKPENEDNAAEMLRSLSNREHRVCTGVTILVGDGSKAAEQTPERVITFSETTFVSFYPMTEEEISSYIDSREPMDKAGAYGIQGLGAKYISGIRGDYNTVVGLPVGRLYQELKKENLL